MKIADSLLTLRALRRLPAPAGNDPRIDLLEAQNAGTARDYVKTRDYAHRAAIEAKSRGALDLFARARLLEGGAMQTMGAPNYDEVETEARKLCEQLGDRQCMSQAWRIRGNDRYYAGKFQEAQDAYLQGVGVARELGDQAELANLLNGLGVVAEANLDWNKAEQNFLEAISLKKETGYNPSEIQVQLADFYRRIGRLQDAARTADAAYTEAQKTNAREEFGEVFLLRAALERFHGHMDTAQELGEKAVAQFRVSKSTTLLTLALAALSSTSTARGDLQNAEKRLAEASKNIDSVNQAEGYPEGQGTIALARAELLLAKGQFQQAADESRRSVANFANAHLHEGSAKALVTEATAFEMLGKDSNALRACQQAQREAAQTPDPLTLASVRLAAWRLSGPDSNEPPDLHESVATLHNPELSLEEDFDRAIRAKRSGAPNTNRLFDALANQAASHGYLTLSRRARSLEQ